MKFLKSSATTSVLIFLFCVITIHHVSCGKSNSSTGTNLESFDDYEAIMAELRNVHNSATNVTEKSIPQQNATALHSSSSNGSLSSAKTRTCACDDSQESLICASNGVTYKNTCRFECAKARVNRLRQVKEGRCSQSAGAQSYWQTKSG